MRKRKTNKAIKDKVTVGMFFRVQWKIIKELYGKYKLWTTVIILFSLVASSSQFIELKFLEYMTNTAAAEIHGEAAVAAVQIGLFFAALLILKVISRIYNVVSLKYQNNIVFDTEQKILKKLSNIPYEYYESKQFYEKIDLASQAQWQYSNAVYGVTELFNIVLMTVVYGIMLSRIQALFVLVIIVSIIVSIAAASTVTDRQLDYWRLHVAPEERRNKYFKGVFGSRVNQQNIQTRRSYRFFSDKFTFYNSRERKNYLKLNMISFFSEFSSLVIFSATFAFTAFLVGKGVVEGKYEIGYFSMVMALLVDFFSVLKSFTRFMLQSNWYIKVLDAYYEILGLKNSDEVIKREGQGEISLDGVKYRYFQSDKYALNGIDAKFKLGEKIAVVGYNGSGKTTMISTLLGLLGSCEGKLTLGSDMVCSAVLQDFGRYQLTVKENVEVGCGGEELTDGEVEDALKKVGLYDYISTLPDGIYTKLGQLENGVELSQGQWQRLAIARLIVNKTANVWILDEPTAYLDPLAEIEMYRLIYGFAGDRLVFFISHRLGFARMTDRIVVIGDGKIIESGSHDELMEKSGGVYREMYDAQKSWYTA